MHAEPAARSRGAKSVCCCLQGDASQQAPEDMQLLARTGWCVAVCTLPVITCAVCVHAHMWQCVAGLAAASCGYQSSCRQRRLLIVNEPQFSGELVHLCAATRGSSTLKYT